MERPQPFEAEALPNGALFAHEHPQDTPDTLEAQSPALLDAWLDELLAHEPAAAHWRGCVGLIVAQKKGADR